uniref:RRM domain-containing protein n=1 Tax=Polytomella parva TaxID=51329 RepID=A0A7S0YE99_9CHLO|mmetsp:Transcript_13369/g.23674  ORF Transcript_13369/g.23674 Transcript_13369/m.23674 type:complete len:328 (+) Transcript_13369:29-1012(+)
MADSGDFSVFVGDLAPDVNDQLLETVFRQQYSSVKGGKVITDPVTGKSKSYGFVRFGLESERDNSLSRMNGQYISTRPVRVSLATTKKAMSGDRPTSVVPTFNGDSDPNNTTLFIGGLNPAVTEEQLRNIFFRFGEIVYTKIPQGKGCGFVQFSDRKSAEIALQNMSGQSIEGQAVRISWGRSSGKGTPVFQQPGAPVAYAYNQYGYPYDPYGYTSYDSMYTNYVYPGMENYMGYGYGGLTPNGMGTMPAVASPGATTAASAPMMMYDPFQSMNVEKSNAAYIQRHMPSYTNAMYNRPMPMQPPQSISSHPSVPMPPQHMHAPQSQQ